MRRSAAPGSAWRSHGMGPTRRGAMGRKPSTVRCACCYTMLKAASCVACAGIVLVASTCTCARARARARRAPRPARMRAFIWGVDDKAQQLVANAMQRRAYVTRPDPPPRLRSTRAAGGGTSTAPGRPAGGTRAASWRERAARCRLRAGRREGTPSAAASAYGVGYARGASSGKCY